MNLGVVLLGGVRWFPIPLLVRRPTSLAFRVPGFRV